MTEGPSTEIAVRPATELDELARLGKWLAALESGSEHPNALGAAAALRFYYIKQLELPPQSVAELKVIKGRLFVGAQLLRALAERQGYRVERTESSDTTCTAQLVRADSGIVLGETTFTIDDAARAGLIRDKGAWQTHPARMLWARASSYVIRDFAPAVSLGIATDDEVDEYNGTVVVQQPRPADDVAWPGEPPPEPDSAATRQRKRMWALLNERGLAGDDKRDSRLAWTATIVGRPVASTSELELAELLKVNKALEAFPPAAGEQAVEQELRDVGAREVPRFEPPATVRERLEQLHEQADPNAPDYNEFPEGY